VGISFVSTDQACANAEEEIGTSSFEEIQKASKALWQEKLSKIEIDVVNTLPHVTEMLYPSLHRASLTPVGVNHRNEVELTVFLQNNATLETQGAFANTTSFYFDSLYCSWDTVSNNDVMSEFNSPTYAIPNILPPHGSSLPSRIRTNRGQLHRWLA
jgi:putative alpha-1,2-mannosidase